MELKSLILGIFMSTAAFALKSGGGLAYLFLKSPGIRKKTTISVLFMAGYGVVFGSAALLLSRVELTAHLDLLQEFFKSGMTLHFILAGLLLLWGISLLRRDNPGKTVSKTRISKTWIALVVPCPVCFSVILLSLAFVTALYPDQPLVAAALYAGFVLVSLGIAFGGAGLVKDSGAAERLLGTLMLFIAVYFLLSVIVVPQFADLEKICRISAPKTSFTLTAEQGFLGVVCLLALAAGFFNPFQRKV